MTLDFTEELNCTFSAQVDTKNSALKSSNLLMLLFFLLNTLCQAFKLYHIKRGMFFGFFVVGSLCFVVCFFLINHNRTTVVPIKFTPDTSRRFLSKEKETQERG